MSVEVILPKLTTTMDEGTIAGWLKQEGDAVQAGQPLFELETDKTTMTVEAPASGFLSRILVPAGSTVPIGAMVALIAIDKEEAAAGTPPAVVVAGQAERRAKVSPLARRVAQTYGVDLSAVAGSGPEGQIIEADVLAAVEHRGVAPVPPAAVPLLAPAASVAAPAASVAAPHPSRHLVPVSPVRRVIAERLSASARTVAQVTVTASADATRLVDWRNRLKDLPGGEPVPTYTDLILFLVARLLPEHPYLNARFEGDAIHLLEQINIGIAVDTERGLLVPVVLEVDKKDLPALTRETAALVEKMHAGRATPEDLSGGTFTLTNLGMYSIETFTPIINLPECAILGLGQISPKPAVYQNELVARHLLALSLSFDHRLVDGAPAARFLQALKALIEEPLLLFSSSARDRL